jgi:hypothetical protein
VQRGCVARHATLPHASRNQWALEVRRDACALSETRPVSRAARARGRWFPPPGPSRRAWPRALPRHKARSPSPDPLGMNVAKDWSNNSFARGWAYSLPLGRDEEHAYGDRELIVPVLVAHLIEQISACVVAFALRHTPCDFLDASLSSLAWNDEIKVHDARCSRTLIAARRSNGLSALSRPPRGVFPRERSAILESSLPQLGERRSERLDGACGGGRYLSTPAAKENTSKRGFWLCARDRRAKCVIGLMDKRAGQYEAQYLTASRSITFPTVSACHLPR